MLVEVIIVTVVVVTIMTSLYVVFNRVYNAYDKKSTYNNIDAIYALKMFEDHLIDTDDASGNIKLNSLIRESGGAPVAISCDGVTYCDSLFKEYNINKLYFVKKDYVKSSNSQFGSLNQTFKEYIDYLNNAVINETTSDYMFIIETHSVESDASILNKYAYLEVRTTDE